MTKKSNIYTRGGDKGETALVGGRRISKTHLRIEAYGTVDELMAQTALLRDLLKDEDLRSELLHILDLQMVTSSMLASDFEVLPPGIPTINSKDVEYLESRIDEMDAQLKPLTSFVLPGGAVEISQAHVVRTVCRRAERVILLLREKEDVDESIVQFYNRLSDYFFVLSRFLEGLIGVNQPPWNPQL